MMLSIPDWIRKLSFEEPTAERIDAVNNQLRKYIAEEPVVSVVIPAYNEEKTIFNTIVTIADSVTTFPFEIVVVDNNSKDRTAEIVKKLHVKYIFEATPGVGPAREAGQKASRGKYIATADSDCFYPATWLQTMYDAINRPGRTCAFSGHTFFDHKTPRWKFYLYGILQKIMTEIRNIRRPFINCHAMSMIYPRDLGVKIGFVLRNVRGEDGRMCFDLMQHGKIKYVRSSKATVWTFPRTLLLDGSIFKALFERIFKEIRHLPQYFTQRKPHDTKTSEN